MCVFQGKTEHTSEMVRDAVNDTIGH